IEVMVSKDKVPTHIAVIMDGNGRWAVERGLPRKEGHLRGVEAVRSVVKNSSELGINVLTLFAFSTENWRRPISEINYLMSLPEIYFKSELPELMKNNVKVNLIGSKERLPGKVQITIDKGIEATKNNTGMILNFALNYGARSEILRAVNCLLDEVKKGKINSAVKEADFEKYLYTAGLPDPDLLIRTSGEQRISNFLLWQLAYSELWFTNVYWPDFSKKHLLNAVYEYQQRKRRYGKV
ncbi:MAG: isoprenyl transferase, partial [Bacillota bacterium]